MDSNIEIDNSHDSLTIDLNGGKIKSLILKDKKILGEFLRADGKMGATHICSPNFGPDFSGKYNLPQHGPARNTLWQIESQENQSLSISCDIKGGNYPQGMKVIQAFELIKDKLTITVIHHNYSALPLPLYLGIHFYWNTSHGWSNITVNKQNIANEIQNNGTIELTEKNSIIIPDIGNITLEQNGLSYAMCWTANKESIFDQQYACIEPIASVNPHFFGTPESMIKPNEETTHRIMLQLNQS